MVASAFCIKYTHLVCKLYKGELIHVLSVYFDCIQLNCLKASKTLMANFLIEKGWGWGLVNAIKEMKDEIGTP